MAEKKWESVTVANKQEFHLEDVVIKDINPFSNYSPNWKATREDQVLHTGSDLLAVMDWCERFLRRTSNSE